MTANPIVPGDLFARHQTIAGLRALADFLEANPAVPVDEYGEDYSVYTRGHCDTGQRTEVDRIAALLGVPATESGTRYLASRTFGRITYRIVHIPARTRAENDARNSYWNNITPDPADHDPAAGQVA
ncbi:hypothetical protein SAMN04489712_15012 [Thermomonospora echinospora]|uniref:Uncharacterized protein n=2 Tax=Thermomonospora echinospora TaxID=1992 RepID=A0A1H6EBQ6_9ACTN|nr:hypothetical protein [Thermomonospora echinospora]SEG94701.1 hypothetical protein SAMN04489712_15012 [Thermomonospora echinospora]